MAEMLDKTDIQILRVLQKNARITQKQAEQRRKEMMEYNFTGTVQQKSYEGLYNVGFVSPDVTDPKKYEKDKKVPALAKGTSRISSRRSSACAAKGSMPPHEGGQSSATTFARFLTMPNS